MSGAQQDPSVAKARAAQYVRMSTEHQKYSTENQSLEIARYAQLYGYQIVRTYEDSGKSGLKLDGRDALQQLIDDVENGRTEFSIILVYDVSRWGRFQNADESAYLEYLCTRAGLKVEYCAEQFTNDGSLTTTIIKNMKRAMAGEYSRELSRKVFEGQCHLIKLGYRQGGSAGFGLRREMIDERGASKGRLNRGERKSLQTDRIILVPGPDHEVILIKRVYRLFVESRWSERSIADHLNSEGISSDLNRPWTRGTIHQLLTNEKYVGNNVFNRTSFKLKKERVRNPPEAVIRAQGAFQPIVSFEMFSRAAEIIAARSARLSNDKMLAKLSWLLLDRGRLSAIIIDEQEGMPSSTAYSFRFGTLLRAYSLIGYTPDRDYRYVETNRFLRRRFPELVANVIDEIRASGGLVEVNETTDLLMINNEFSLSVIVSRCFETKAGNLRWKMRLDSSLAPDLSVAVRMAPGNIDVLDYYLLPRLDFAAMKIRLSEENGLGIDSYRCPDLTRLVQLAERTPIRRAS